MELRDYQKYIVDTYSEALKKKGSRYLIQAPTGSGKTVIFSSIIKRLMDQYPDRVKFLIMAHRKELITQAKDKLVAVAPELEDKIGIFSASVGEKSEKQITIASPQTLVNHNFGAFSIIIVDECHRLPLMGNGSVYEKIINRLFDLNMDTRLLGFTATPYRLGHGNIYGNHSDENWFPELNFSINIEYMQNNGYLVQDDYKVIKGIENDLKNVKKSMGEYKASELTEVVTKRVHIDSAIGAMKKYADDRMKVVIFAVSISHAEVLADMLPFAKPIHSKLKKQEREQILKEFADGDIRFLVNVDILTEGFDEPSIDCVILLRPSMSTALYVQMVGRGLRLAEGKGNCLVLDIAGLYKQHGYFKDIELDFEKGEKGKEREAPTKVCPLCDKVNPASTSVCECGYEFTDADLESIEGDIEMENVKRDKKVEILSVSYKDHIAESGSSCLKLGVKTTEGWINHFYVKDRPSHLRKLTKIAKKYLDYNGDMISAGKFVALMGLIPLTGTAKLYESNGWKKLRGF